MTIWTIEEREEVCVKQNELEIRLSEISSEVSKLEKSLRELRKKQHEISRAMTAFEEIYDLDVHVEHEGETPIRIWTVYE